MESASDDVESLIEGLDKGRQAWINGKLEWAGTSVFHQADTMTIFGPFGGEAALGDPERQATAAANFRGGTGHCQAIWLRLHRHADPLMKRRSLPETLALLRDDTESSA